MRSEEAIRQMLEVWRAQHLADKKAGENYGWLSIAEARIEELEWVLGERNI